MRGHVVRAGGKDDEWHMRRHWWVYFIPRDSRDEPNRRTTRQNRNQKEVGGSIMFNHSPTTGHINQCRGNSVNRYVLRKAGRGRDWANLSGIVCVADVGSLTTLSKKFLKGTSTVDRGRVPAPRLDSLRTARRSGMWPVRSVDVCSIFIDPESPWPICGSSATRVSVGEKTARSCLC